MTSAFLFSSLRCHPQQNTPQAMRDCLHAWLVWLPARRRDRHALNWQPVATRLPCICKYLHCSTAPSTHRKPCGAACTPQSQTCTETAACRDTAAMHLKFVSPTMRNTQACLMVHTALMHTSRQSMQRQHSLQDNSRPLAKTPDIASVQTARSAAPNLRGPALGVHPVSSDCFSVLVESKLPALVRIPDANSD
jgi:hypothetical protein